jgi:glycosyltransferase involved in cell wall biosynthesis
MEVKPGWPRVDVVVATRNRLELLKRAVQSVLDQNYPGEIRIIVVFDQSPPVDDLVRAGPNRSIVVVQNSRTPGLAGARNTGILAARSDLVAFCDDDDEWLETKLRIQVGVMSDMGAGASVTGIRIRRGEEQRDRIPDQKSINISDLARSRVTGAHPSTYLVRRELLIDRVGLVDEELPFGYGEDYDLLIRLARTTTIAVVREPLVLVHWHPSSYFAGRWEAMAAGVTYLLRKHPELRRSRRGHAWVEGQQAFAYAAAGRGWLAVNAAMRSLARNPREPRAVLALLVCARVLSARRVIAALNRRGRGI